LKIGAEEGDPSEDAAFLSSCCIWRVVTTVKL
jgi:hypothetical protein